MYSQNFHAWNIHTRYMHDKLTESFFNPDLHASTLLHRHSLHAIASQLSPLHGCSGIELLESETFDLHCFETPTGTKFLLVVEPRSPYIPNVMKR